MNREITDVPNVIIFPPLIPIAALTLSALLQWLRPLNLLTKLDATVRFTVGLAIIAAGLALIIAGVRMLLRHNTHVQPSLPTLVLVTGGVYARTRNPLYMGGNLVMLGCAVLFALDWLPLFYIFSFLILHFGIVLPEEIYLERKFGEHYRNYKSSVPRYLF